ncbi:cobalt ECF transporter T component CbiQ [Acidimangrovimonas pyrenivorans]|uniref:Cobalt ECF transporter T component CbiQ n=1 Tax=Acidimangrovimonas pyrenivorans TaxID=2030798 RepID=A0ABV7AI55_9RHOB
MAHRLGPRPALGDTVPAVGDGLIPARDPRLRVALAVAFALETVALTSLPALVLALAAALVLLALSGLPPRRTLKRMAGMDGFILFMLLLLPFTVPGPAAFTLLGWSASWDGLRQAAAIALTANAVILALMALVGSMEPATLGHALHALRVPERLVHLMMFTIRYVDVLRDEYARLRVSMRVRGFRPGTNLHTWRSLGYLVGMMLVRALERSERILDAMKCRGFQGRLPMLDSFALRPADLLFAAGVMALLALPIGVDLHGAH